MTHKLEFEMLIEYDNGEVGIPVNIRLTNSLSFVSLVAKVDTASTFCIFERKYGELLGLIVESGIKEKIGTATGAFTVFGHEVTLITEDSSFDSVVFFAENEFFNKNVLGRHGWLDRVRIALDDYEGKLYISPKSYE